MRIALLVALCSSAAIGCSGDEITTTAWTEFKIVYKFTQGEASYKATLDPQQQVEIQAITDVTCAVLDVENSSLSLVSFDGEEGEPFTLKAVLEDGADQITLFEWSATLDSDAKIVPLGSSAANLNAVAATRIGEIARGADKRFVIRYDWSAPSNPAETRIRVILRIHLAGPDGTCPAGS